MSEMEAKVYNTVATYNNIGINCKGVSEIAGTTRQNIKGKLDRLNKHGLIKKIGYRYFLERNYDRKRNP